MLYIILGAAATVLFLAGAIWYFAGQIQYVIDDQDYEVPFYKWDRVKDHLATVLVYFYIAEVVWIVIGGIRFGLFGRVDNYFNSMTLSWPASIVIVGLVLLAALPAIVCIWLESWLEKNHKSSNLNREKEKTWATKLHPSS